MSLRILDPTLESEAAQTGLAPALPSLEGRVIGLLDNNKHKVRDLLDQVEAILRTEYRVRDVIRLRKSDASRPAPPEVVARFGEVDALFSAVGD
ncbi:MAG TPA: hypothetical protein VHL09_17635 [Dehalococcoidia bacterium]|nr:hypothetical protein [Dehalococcoidia bacterium]